MRRVDLRTITMDIPPQDVITTRQRLGEGERGALLPRRRPENAVIVEVENYLFATSQLAQTTLRSVCGQAELDELLAEREKINEQIQEILDEQTDPWGIKVTAVEIKHIDLPQEMQRAMARQAEAERERRAKVIDAEGEFQAAQQLAEAAASHRDATRSRCSCATCRRWPRSRPSTTRRPSSRCRSTCYAPSSMASRNSAEGAGEGSSPDAGHFPSGFDYDLPPELIAQHPARGTRRRAAHGGRRAPGAGIPRTRPSTSCRAGSRAATSWSSIAAA